jgi:hypothetical protein
LKWIVQPVGRILAASNAAIDLPSKTQPDKIEELARGGGDEGGPGTMTRWRISEDKIVGILKEHEASRKVAELARELASARRCCPVEK